MSLDTLLENSEEINPILFEQIIQDGMKDAFIAGNDEAREALNSYIQALEEEVDVDSDEFIAFEETVSEFIAPFLETSTAIYGQYLFEANFNQKARQSLERQDAEKATKGYSPNLPGAKEVKKVTASDRADQLAQADKAYQAYSPETPETKGLLRRMRIKLTGWGNRTLGAGKKKANSVLDVLKTGGKAVGSAIKTGFNSPMNTHKAIMSKGGYVKALKGGVAYAGAALRHPLSAVHAVKGAIAQTVLRNAKKITGLKSGAITSTLAKSAVKGRDSRATLSTTKANLVKKMTGSPIATLVKKPA